MRDYYIVNTTYLEFTPALYKRVEKFMSDCIEPASDTLSIRKYGFILQGKVSGMGKPREVQIHTVSNASETYFEETEYINEEVLGKMTPLWGIARDSARSPAEYAALLLIKSLGLETDSYLHFTRKDKAWTKRFIHQAFEALVIEDGRGEVVESSVRVDNSQLTDEQYVDLIQAMKKRYGFGKFSFASLAGMTYFTFDPSFEGEPLTRMEKPGCLGSWTGTEPKPIEILKPLRETKGLF